MCSSIKSKIRKQLSTIIGRALHYILRHMTIDISNRVLSQVHKRDPNCTSSDKISLSFGHVDFKQ